MLPENSEQRKIEVTVSDAPLFFGITTILSELAAQRCLLQALGQANEIVLQKLQRDQMAMGVAAGALHRYIQEFKKNLTEAQRMSNAFFDCINQRGMSNKEATNNGSIENQKTAT